MERFAHRGNSNSYQRIVLFGRFVKLLGKDRIEAVTGDQEFVGKKWFNWLRKQKIPFVLRIRDNFRVATTCGRTTYVWNYFRNLKICQQKVPGVRKVAGVKLMITGIRMPGNEYVILVSDRVEAEDTFRLYRERWRIETLFEKLKSHGFDLESFRLRGRKKAGKLFAVDGLMLYVWPLARGRGNAIEIKKAWPKGEGCFPQKIGCITTGDERLCGGVGEVLP